MRSDKGPQFEPAGTFDYVRKAVEVVKLNRAVMAEVAADMNVIRFGLAVTAIGGAVAVLPYTNIRGIIVAAVYSIAALFLFAGFVHVMAGYSGGKQEFMGFVRVIALSGIIDWVAVVPVIGLFATTWSVVIAVVAARQIYDLRRGRAAFVVILATLVMWAITAMIFSGSLGSLYKMRGA
ncbi:MAG: hypothetical protein J7J91_03920 [Deltaproteobacteria bacterium]|nr:hypothetical protein [Deltaproteobacteria bacterium]